MELEVVLREGEDPYVYNKATEEDVTNQVAEVVILPDCQAKARLYLLDDTGHIHRDGDEIAAAWHAVTRISGTWTGKG